MGDVAMCVPVLRALLNAHPELRLTMLSDARWAPLFTDLPGLTFVGVELKGRHRGLLGLFRLFRELRQFPSIQAVADLHGVLRTYVLGGLFAFSGIPLQRIDKGRAAKRKLVARYHKIRQPLRSGVERYADVFRKLGLDFPATSLKAARPEKSTVASASRPLIGVAPFAKHAEKAYPPERMRQVVARLAQQGYRIYLFGAAGVEAKQLAEWSSKLGDDVISLAGTMSLKQELEQLATLDLMVSMDSANMHLASLLGVPVVSVWGPTHPFAGFYGWNQDPRGEVSLPLDCRPCSVYGNKPCFRGDHACMTGIEPEKILEKIEEVLSRKPDLP